MPIILMPFAYLLVVIAALVCAAAFAAAIYLRATVMLFACLWEYFALKLNRKRLT
tara:strand:+ start:1006 stop:1170 length:165 start_codon:yes stop_codon:yes gene_type:complete